MQRLSEYLEETNLQLKNTNLFRNIEDKVIAPHELCFSGNDYLGLAREYFSLEPAEGEHNAVIGFSGQVTAPFGSTGSRLTTGTHQIHLDLEKLIARWKKTEDAMLFSSGYMANLGAISVLIDSRDLVYVDEIAHACIYDGIRLSKARKFIFRHNDYQHLEELLEKSRGQGSKALIITDSVFSMDGDRAPIAEMAKLATKYSASLYVDEAHSAGVLGSHGAGLVEELIDEGAIKLGAVEIQMGTFSKAIGLEGAYIAGSSDLITYLRNKARTFIYSTAPSPLVIAEAYTRIKKLYENDPEMLARRKRLRDNIIYFREKLAGIEFRNDMTAIFAVFVGDIDKTLETAAKLREQRIFVTAIRPPTVKQARLRISMSSEHTKSDIDKLVSLL